MRRWAVCLSRMGPAYFNAGSERSVVLRSLGKGPAASVASHQEVVHGMRALAVSGKRAWAARVYQKLAAKGESTRR